MKKLLIESFLWGSIAAVLFILAHLLPWWVGGAGGSFLFGMFFFGMFLNWFAYTFVGRERQNMPFWSMHHLASILIKVVALLLFVYGFKWIFGWFEGEQSIGFVLLGCVIGAAVWVTVSAVIGHHRGKIGERA